MPVFKVQIRLARMRFNFSSKNSKKYLNFCSGHEVLNFKITLEYCEKVSKYCNFFQAYVIVKYEKGFTGNL